MVHSVEGIIPADDVETAINVTAFKAQCLALIDAVAEGKASRVVLTRRGRPVAALVPYGKPPAGFMGCHARDGESRVRHRPWQSDR